MQNNVTDLSQKLQRSLDNNYNVTDMPAVIEIISALEKTSVTKELLQTTRLGKYINELRRRTSNETLAKRAKDLLKKWRDSLITDANGKIKRADSPSAQRASKKRSAKAPESTKPSKRQALNGQNREFDFSDNSDCSEYKKSDIIFINSDSNSSMPDASSDAHSADVISVDSSQNAIPKKRGRKKGSKNHKNLVIAAEESFSNKMAVSRNSKVKTTQELLADLQNRSTKSSNQQDIELRAAQLTESLNKIDQKLNPQKTINKNVTPIKTNSSKSAPHRTSNEVSSRSSTPEIVTIQSDDEIVDVVGTDPPATSQNSSISTPTINLDPENSLPDTKNTPTPEPLTVEGLLALLPPIDPSCLEEEAKEPQCLCPVPQIVDQAHNELIRVEIVGENSEKSEISKTSAEKSVFAPVSPPVCDANEPDNEIEERTSDICDNCPAKLFLKSKYLTDSLSVDKLHSCYLPNVNGNFGAQTESEIPNLGDSVVPKIGVERLKKELGGPEPQENFQKYRISENSDSKDNSEQIGEVNDHLDSCDRTKEFSGPPESISDEFREWHETVDVRSYNGELLRILPYVIID